VTALTRWELYVHRRGQFALKTVALFWAETELTLDKGFCERAV